VNTEIESRYVVPDRILFSKLLELRQLEDYALEPHGRVKIVDHYLDTKGRALLNQGWACRLRSQDEQWFVTLKAPKSVRGAIVSRFESEMPLPGPIEDVANWPAGELRDQVSSLTGGSPLRRLLIIRQNRRRFLVTEGLRSVAELSLDVVRMASDGLRHLGYILECELLPEGSENDLRRIDTILSETYLLIPEPRSKLQRGLEFVSLGRSPDEGIASRRPRMTVSALCSYYQIDAIKSAHVTALSDLLYSGLLPIHELPESRRSLLHAAASLHEIGVGGGPLGNARDARDLILSQPIVGFDEEAQRMLAAAIFLHRRRISSSRLDAAFPKSLSPRARQEALAIASLIRMASALDSSETQTTQIQDVQVRERRAVVMLSGPWSEEDAQEAQMRSDLWATLYGEPIAWQAVGHGQAGTSEGKLVGLHAGDTMVQAARKILAFHWERMLEHETGTRLGQDPEELHDMRVATRRLRSALRLFAHHLTGTHVTASVEGLRRLARLLGQVRDLDVAMLKARRYLQGLPPDQQGSLDPLFRLWQRQRQSARRRMIGFLNSKAYPRLADEFHAMLADLAVFSEPSARPAREDAPRFISLYWQIVRAYGAVLEGAPIEVLHALRIDSKRLRYALEFFREILPPQAGKIIPEVVTIQDHLGDLHDAAVAVHMLDGLIGSVAAEDQPGLQAYRDQRFAEMKRLQKTFGPAWERFTRPKMDRWITYALAQEQDV